jgi:hypothetical protein
MAWVTMIGQAYACGLGSHKRQCGCQGYAATGVMESELYCHLTSRGHLGPCCAGAMSESMVLCSQGLCWFPRHLLPIHAMQTSLVWTAAGGTALRWSHLSPWHHNRADPEGEQSWSLMRKIWPCSQLSMGWQERGRDAPRPTCNRQEIWVPGHESGKAALTLISCITQESRSCTLSGQHRRANPGNWGAGKPAWGHENKRAAPAPCWLQHWVTKLGQCWRASPGGVGSWEVIGWPPQLPPRLRSRAFEFDPPQHLFHLCSAGMHERAGHAGSKLRDLHDTGQKNIREESWRGSSIDNVAEARGLEPDEWLFAMNICK